MLFPLPGQRASEQGDAQACGSPLVEVSEATAGSFIRHLQENFSLVGSDLVCKLEFLLRFWVLIV